MHTSSIERRPSAGDSVTRSLRRDATTRILLHYETEDAGAHAEVTYCYRPDEQVVLDDGRVVAADKIQQGNRICLEDGGTATVTATKEIPWEAYAPALPPRIIGTVKYLGFFQRIDFRVAGGATIGTTPEHAFWSINRQAWKPISSFRIGEALLAQDGQTSTLEWISDPYTEWCELRNIEVEQVHRFQVGNTPQGGLWTHNGLDNSCRVPRAKTVPRNRASAVIDDLVETGNVQIKTARGAGATNVDNHHIATNKSKFWSRLFKELFDPAGIGLDDVINKVKIPGHKGGHGFYNFVILQRLRSVLEGTNPLTQRYKRLLQRELLLIRRELLDESTALSGILKSASTLEEARLARSLAQKL